MQINSTGIVVILTAVALGACSDSTPCPTDGDGPELRFAPNPADGTRPENDWLAIPFPLDTNEGGPDWSHYPNPFNVGLLDDYIKVVSRDISGFSTNGALYFQFATAIDTSNLPRDNASPPYEILKLVDIDPASPEYGRAYPLRWQYWEAQESYVPGNTLAVAPHWGFPLREDTTYALLIQEGLVGKNGSPVRASKNLRALLGDLGATGCGASLQPTGYSNLSPVYTELRTYLQEESISVASIMGAAVFTTQIISQELNSIHQQVTANDPPSLDVDTWKIRGENEEFFTQESFKWNRTDTAEFYLMEGALTLPNYQEGDVPYNREGALHFENNSPVPVREETTRFTLAIPKTPPENGSPCYPIVHYAHGTGGDAYSMVPESAGRFAARGLATISIDMPLHGPRSEGSPFDVNMATFNFVNPDSARSGFRQAAIDTWVLNRFVRESLVIDAAHSPTGSAICFDDDHIGFFGHSQGGLSGAIALAFEQDIEAWVLSGAGGGLSITVMERKDVANFEELVRFLAEIPSGEVLSELHPILTLIQTAVDVTDPINYSPGWNPRRATQRKSVLVTSGCYDEQTPHRSATAMAVAGRIPLVAPAAMDSPLFEMADLPEANAPLHGNLAEQSTGGFLQWCGSVLRPNESNHYVVFNRPEAIHATTEFLRSSLAGNGATIERVVDANVR